MNYEEKLQGVLNLLSDQKHWTQKAFARNAKGEALQSGNDPDAVCWCVVGAVEKVMEQETAYSGPARAVRAYIELAAQRPLIDFNDTCTHYQAVMVLRKAVAIAKTVTDPINQIRLNYDNERIARLKPQE